MSGGLAVIIGPAALLKCHINCNTVKTPHYHPKKFCRHVLPRCGVPRHAFITSGLYLSLIICAPTFYILSRFLLYKDDLLVKPTLCSLSQPDGCNRCKLLPAGRMSGSWLPIWQEFPFFKTQPCCLSFAFEFQMCHLCLEISSYFLFFQLRMFWFLKELISVLKWFLGKAFKLAEFVSLLIL